MSNLSSFIKYQRKQMGFTQEDLATKAGVGIRFIREMEQGKESLQLDKVEQVLALFGFEMAPVKQQLNAYDVYWNYLNKAVKIKLITKIEKHGILLKEVIDNKENKIVAWRFLSINNLFQYQEKEDENLVETILHSDIQDIEKV